MGSDHKAPHGGTSVRVSQSGPLHELTDDPVERYQYHFAHLIERNLEVLDHPMHALDLACGVGMPALTLIERLPAESRIVALGDDRSDLRRFHDKLNTEQKRVIFPRKERRDRLPFAANIFDVVWAALPSEQFDPVRAVLRQALRVLRPGGQLLFSAPLRATFAELANAIGSSVEDHRDDEAYSALLSQPPQLLGSDDWAEALRRCGAIEIEVIRDKVELIIATPLSSQPLFTQYLLPLWLGDDPTVQAKALRLLDEAVAAPLGVTIHVGCILARRGLSEMIEDSITR
jgi:SAM-dependent methyltransferase